MNTAFKKGKLSKYFGSSFYKKYCSNPDISYNNWLSIQSNKTQNNILGKGKAEIFRCSGGDYRPAPLKNFGCSYTFTCKEEEL